MNLIKTAAIGLVLVLFQPLAATSKDNATNLSAAEAAIIASVDKNFDESLKFLETVVNINSGTMHHEGVQEVGGVFSEAFAELGFTPEWLDQAEVDRAGHMVASRDGEGPHILLIGHLDTVFPKDSPVQEFRLDGDKVWGPGVNDMKGGDVVVLYALKALHGLGHLDARKITVFFTGDEEKTGKPISVSRAALIEAAKQADVALNFEGGENGVVVTSRRGASGWKLTTTGRRRHSSRIFSENVGAGAVFETARILNAFYEDLSEEEYLTFNPGVIVGGTDVDYDPGVNRGDAFGKTNVVAQKVVTHGGLRFISEKQKEKARKKMRKIVDKNLPRTDAEIEFTDSYPAMTPTEGNEQLLSVYAGVSADLGFGPVVGNDPAKRGAADISFAAPHTPASMDGLGVAGDGAHTPEESMELQSLKDATQRTALLLYRLLHEDEAVKTD